MKKIFAILFAFVCTQAVAQEAATIKFLPQLQESQWYCAANQNDAKITVGLPVISSLYFDVYNSGFTYHSLFSKANDGSTVINANSFVNGLKPTNYLGLNLSATLLSATYNAGEYTAGFSVTDRFNVQMTYPDAFFKLLWNGNAAYIGKSMDIGSFSLNAMWYREYALHGTKKHGKWTFGASPKLLFGKTNVHTQRSSVSLYTDTGWYALTVKADMGIQTSGIPDSAEQEAGYLDGSQKVNDYVFNKANKGFAIDLGASYQYNDKLILMAGINNLGSIGWKSNIHNYTANNSFSFDGLDISGFFQGDSSVISTQKWVDSVKKIIDFKKSKESYKTALPYELYVMGDYTYGKHHFAAMLAAQRYNRKYLVSGTLCYKLVLGKHFSGVVTYTAKTKAAANLGGGMVARFAGMQFYVLTDNVVAVFKPLDSRYANTHLGINLVFGKVKKHENKEEVRE